ncbi:MAG: hypothetical protein GWP91_05885 [Rhodobacterales bacterium]|nr:hypothetical protein [Rhodobacterales bacterium]
MDALLVAVLTAITAVLGVFWWNILTRPELILSGFQDANHDGEGWFEHHPGALKALRLVVGGLVFVSGFMTGLALTFLARTG